MKKNTIAFFYCLCSSMTLFQRIVFFGKVANNLNANSTICRIEY